MQTRATELPGVVILEPRVFEDARGFFLESYNQHKLADLGITCRFVQDNHSRSSRGVLRGLHYQLGKPQAKLVRVTRGAVLDVVVDIRRNSPAFGQWTAVELSEHNHRMLFAPEGVAHGFLVLSEEVDFLYKCSDFYAPEEERGVLYNDPAIGIPWPLDGIEPILSERDAQLPTLAEVDPDQLPVWQADQGAHG